MYGIKNIIVFGVLTFFVSPGTLYSMGDFNFDSMENLQQELEEANRAIEEYISSLPAEEQAEFNRQVDEVTQMFENMSEDEFASFLNEMFAEEPMMPLPTEPSMSQPVFAPETPALTSEQKKKVDNVITVINDIIRQSNIFLVQISSSLEASKNIDSWSKKGAIMYWQPNTDWQNLKFDIEKFVQQLYKLEDKDLTTQEYKYILDLIADEATLNNLIQLQTNLNASIPQIEISEMDIKALSAQSKEVIKNSLQYYTEALYVLNLPKAIDTIIEKYSSKAEKSREAEEAAEKRAAEAAKRPRAPIGASTAGVEQESGYGYDSGYGYGGYDYGSYGGGYGSDYYGGGYGDFGGGSYGGEEGGKEGRGKGGASGGGRGGMGGGGGVAGAEGEEGQKKSAQPTTGGPVVAPTKNPLIKELVNEILDGAKEIAKIVEDNSLFSTLSKHVKGEDDTTDMVGIIDVEKNVIAIHKKLKALEQEIQSLQSMMLKANKATQAYYNKKFTAILEKPLETIHQLKEELDKIEFKKIKNKQIKITPEKEWAYFAGNDKLLDKLINDKATGTEEVQTFREEEPKRVSLAELLEAINAFESTLKTLKEKTAQPTKQTTVTTTTVTPSMPIEQPMPSPTPEE